MCHSEELGNNHESSCLKAYELVLKIYELGISDYFKRTQILMVVIQSVLFLAFSKLVQSGLFNTGPGYLKLTEDAKAFVFLSMLGLISALGVAAAWAWHGYIVRRIEYAAFCRWYMRDVESQLLVCVHDTPLQYFSKERDVFYRKEHISAKYNEDDVEFPYTTRPAKGGSMKIDKRISIALLFIWLGLFLICLITAVYFVK